MDIPNSPELILKDVQTNLAKDFPLEFLAVTKNTDLSTLTRAIIVFRAPWDIALGQAHSGNITVAGDAMHPMTPEISLGASSALVDAVFLARYLIQDRGVQHWPEKALQKYFFFYSINLHSAIFIEQLKKSIKFTYIYILMSIGIYGLRISNWKV